MSHPITSVEAEHSAGCSRQADAGEGHQPPAGDRGREAGRHDRRFRLRGQHRQSGKAKRETVADVMSDAILVCRDQTPATSAARTMTQAGWRSVLVVDARGRPLGVVSEKDLIPLLQNGINDEVTVSQVMHKMRDDRHPRQPARGGGPDDQQAPSPRGGDGSERSGLIPTRHRFFLRHRRRNGTARIRVADVVNKETPPQAWRGFLVGGEN